MQCKWHDAALGILRSCCSFANQKLAISIVALPAYFAFVYGSDRAAVSGFFTSVADKSPLPLIIYNVSARECDLFA